MAVRCKLAYALSYRDIEELLDERGVKAEHSTVQRWVVQYSPELEQSFRKRKRPVGSSWRMDETYIKVKGRWCYLYRDVLLKIKQYFQFYRILSHPNFYWH